MKGISNQFSSIEQVTNQYLNQQRISDSTNVSGKSFDEILKEKQNENSLELKFSKHASMRLSDRNITLTDASYPSIVIKDAQITLENS